MHAAAEYVGGVSIEEQEKYRAKRTDGADEAFVPEATFILGGQIRGASASIELIYPEGSFVRASAAAPFLQIGEPANRRGEVRQADSRPHHQPPNHPRCCGKMRLGIDGFHHAQQRQRRPAIGMSGLSSKQLWRRYASRLRRGRRVSARPAPRLVGRHPHRFRQPAQAAGEHSTGSCREHCQVELKMAVPPGASAGRRFVAC